MDKRVQRCASTRKGGASEAPPRHLARSHTLARRLARGWATPQVTENGDLVESYTYDANGNRTSSLNGAGVFAATFDDQDRMQTYDDASYTYSANGELAYKMDPSDGTTAYTYDALGNLRRVVLPSGMDIEYVVDGEGRRVGKKVNGVLTQGWLWRSKLQPVAELDGAGNVVARFVYASGGGGNNVPELIVTAGATYRLVKDHLGSVRVVVDVATGAVAQEMSYDAWGRVLVDTNPGFQPFGFAGGMWDADTGLVRFGARDYDAWTGRWTSRDPIGLRGGVNVFGYGGGDPMNRTDPTGLYDSWYEGWLAVKDQALGSIAAGAGTVATAAAGLTVGQGAAIVAGGALIGALVGFGILDAIGTFGGGGGAVGPNPEWFPPMDEGYEIKDDAPECGPYREPWVDPKPDPCGGIALGCAVYCKNKSATFGDYYVCFKDCMLKEGC